MSARRSLAAGLVALALSVAAAGCGGDPGGAAVRPPGVEATNVWWTTSPAAEGLRPAAIERAAAALREERAGGSLLVARHGRIAYEAYWGGVPKHRPREVLSVTKSVLSALVGIAVADGRLELDAPVADVFPRALRPGAAARLRGVTPRRLLTMTAGYPGDGAGAATPAGDVDWVRLLLNRKLVARPGTRFAYDGGSAHLLSAALTRTAGRPADRLAAERLFRPLGITSAVWRRDGRGNAGGGTGLLMTPRDLAKIGQLYLRGGRWGERRILPAQWVRDSTSAQVRPAGRGPAYGYLWWVVEGRGSRAFAAVGAEGQVVLVSPADDLVVVTTGTSAVADPWPVVLRLVREAVPRAAA